MVVTASKRLLFVKGEIDVSTISVASLLVKVLKVFDLLAFVDQKSTNHNGASIDHWVMRSALLIENGRVENLTAWLFANKFVNICATAL